MAKNGKQSKDNLMNFYLIKIESIFSRCNLYRLCERDAKEAIGFLDTQILRARIFFFDFVICLRNEFLLDT